MIRSLPKAELHCHIEGAADIALVRAQAEKYGADLSQVLRDGAFLWHDFASFLAAYDLVASLFRNEEDYALLALSYLSGLAEQGAIYSEFFISIDHARQAGLSPRAYVDGLAQGMEEARHRHGIVSRMIAIGIRHLGPESVEQVADWAADNPHPLITGFGMAGDESRFSAHDFARAFDIARDCGLGLTVHAGEICGAQSVRDCLDHLRPARIGHGVRAIEDPALVTRLAAERVVLEVCPASNIALGIFPSFAAHPLRKLHDQGCVVTLNSDDPPYFATSLTREYEIAHSHAGFSADELLQITRNAIEAAFIDEDSRALLLEQCQPGERIRETSHEQ